MYKNLKNKVVIITGGAGSIGQATVKAFLENESRVVVVVDKNKEKLESFERKLNGQRAKFILADLSQTAQVKQMVKEVSENFGQIDILVNLAGNAFGGDITEIDDETYWRDINTNLTPTFLCTREILPHMQKNGYGVIVNISSVNSIVGIGEAAYSAAKAGINSLTQSTAVKYGRYGIRCNCLALGTIKTETPNWQQRLEEDPRIFEKIASKIPRKKVGEPEEAASLILFFASENSRLINGAIVVADGGWTLTVGTVKEKEGFWWEDN